MITPKFRQSFSRSSGYGPCQSPKKVTINKVTILKGTRIEPNLSKDDQKPQSSSQNPTVTPYNQPKIRMRKQNLASTMPDDSEEPIVYSVSNSEESDDEDFSQDNEKKYPEASPMEVDNDNLNNSNYCIEADSGDRLLIHEEESEDGFPSEASPLEDDNHDSDSNDLVIVEKVDEKQKKIVDNKSKAGLQLNGQPVNLRSLNDLMKKIKDKQSASEKPANKLRNLLENSNLQPKKGITFEEFSNKKEVNSIRGRHTTQPFNKVHDILREIIPNMPNDARGPFLKNAPKNWHDYIHFLYMMLKNYESNPENNAKGKPFLHPYFLFL